MWALQGDVNVKFPLDAPGLAPTCGREVEVINIPDAYKDHRFNQNIDKQTNYTTKSILCHPVCADNGETCVGVVQLAFPGWWVSRQAISMRFAARLMLRLQQRSCDSKGAMYRGA